MTVLNKPPKPNMSKPAYADVPGPISAADAHAEPQDARAFTMPEAELPAPPKGERVNGKALQIQITAVYEGWTVALSFEGQIDRLPTIIERLRAVGATPTTQAAQQWSYTPDGLPICPRHGAPMKKREKQGDIWYSHVVTAPDGDDLYCRGYHGKDSPGYDH